jgi:hypothetical protein
MHWTPPSTHCSQSIAIERFAKVREHLQEIAMAPAPFASHTFSPHSRILSRGNCCNLSNHADSALSLDLALDPGYTRYKELLKRRIGYYQAQNTCHYVLEGGTRIFPLCPQCKLPISYDYLF